MVTNQFINLSLSKIDLLHKKEWVQLVNSFTNHRDNHQAMVIRLSLERDVYLKKVCMC